MSGLLLSAVSTSMDQNQLDFRGTVIHCFSNSCVIETHGTNSSGRLISVLSSDYPESPDSIRARLPKGFDFRDHIQLGSSVSAKDNLINFGIGELYIDTHLIPHVDLSLDSQIQQLPDLGMGDQYNIWRSWLFAWEYLSQNTKRNRKLNALEANAVSLMSMYIYKDTDNLSNLLKQMIGNGHGPVHEADDFLVGFMAGLQIGELIYREMEESMVPLGDSTITNTFRNNIVENMQLCEDISIEHYRTALDHQFPSPIINMATQIIKGEKPAQCMASLESFSTMAHQDGMALLMGLLYSMALLHVRARNRVIFSNTAEEPMEAIELVS